MQDWGSAFCKWTCITDPSFQRVIIHSPKDEAATKEFVNCLKKFAPLLEMKMEAPKSVMLIDN